MEKKIVVSRRFRKNSLEVFEYLIKEYSQKTAFNFLNKLEQCVEFIIRFPEIDKPSELRPNVRSVTPKPQKRIYYRINLDTVNYCVCLI